MKNVWIIAQAQENGSGVTSEPITEQQGQVTTPQTVQPADTNQAPVPQAEQQPGSVWGQVILFVGFLVILYFLFVRGPRKQQQKHKQMISSLEKNNRIRTVGGIIGTVVDIKEDHIILKIDESNNTKIRITPNAVGANLSRETGKNS